MNWDLFLSHASEDDSFASLLNAELDRRGLRVWYDKAVLRVGQSLLSAIDEGLVQSRFGVVIISPHFLTNRWTKKELAGLVAREVDGTPVVLPVWHNIGEEEIRQYSPTLADRVAVSSSEGVAGVADAIVAAMGGAPPAVQYTIAATATEYGEAMELIKRILRSYAPQFAKEFPFDRKAVDAEVMSEFAFRLMPARAMIFGHTGVGKTTIINKLLEKDIFPASGELTCTRSLAAAQHKGGLVFYDSPGIGDEPLQENITRAALGIKQLEEEPVQSIRLLDLTEGYVEGPAAFRKLAWKDIAEELRGKRSEISGKEFKLADFQTWLTENPFNFVVFVMSSEKGLSHSDCKLIKDFHLRHEADGSRFFKVLNVFHGGYRSTVQALDGGVRNRLIQAQERLAGAGVPDAKEWVILDAKEGAGLDSFVRAFAENLPVEVLANLSLVLSRKYSHLVQDKIDQYYRDYLGRIASLIAVFPADQSEGSHELLEVALDSLVGLAELMAPGKKNQDSRRLVDDVIQRVKGASLRGVYGTYKDYRWDFLPRSWSEHWKLYDVKKRKTDEYFAVGGIQSVRLVLPLGLAISRVFRGEIKDLGAAWKECVAKADARIEEISSEVVRITRNAGKGSKESRIELADQLYLYLRRIL